MAEFDSDSVKVQKNIYAFDSHYLQLKKFFTENEHSDVPEDHGLYHFACQVCASFQSKFRNQKKHRFAKYPAYGTILKEHIDLLNSIVFVWKVPPHFWSDVTNAYKYLFVRNLSKVVDVMMLEYVVVNVIDLLCCDELHVMLMAFRRLS